MITFYSDNLLSEADLLGDENALFPLSNLKDARRTKVFRSLTNQSQIIIDHGSVKAMDSIMVVDSPRTGFGVSSLTLELNSTNNWASPAFSIELEINQTHGIAFAEFETKNFRFARLVMTSNNSYCELSNLFIGEKISFENGTGIDLGWSFKDKELSTIKENRYGQKFVDVITRQRELDFSIRSMNKDELDQVLQVYDSKGLTEPFFARIKAQDIVNDADRFAGMFFLSSIPGITNRTFGLFDISFNLEEAM